MNAKRLKELNDLFDRLWRRIYQPDRAITVSGLRMNQGRIATLNRAYINQSARQFDGLRG